MHRLCALLVLVCEPALALPWVAPDTDTAQALRTDLDRLWSTHDITVTTGTINTGDYVAFTGDQLVLSLAGHRYETLWDGRTDTAVVLTRSWLRSLRIADAGWVPDLDEPPTLVVLPVPADPPETVPVVRLARPHLSAGVGLRMSPADNYAADGPRFVASLRSGPLGLEAAAFLGVSGLLNIGDETTKLFSRNGGRSYRSRASWVDTAALSVSGELALASPSAGVQVGPVLSAGVALTHSIRRHLSSDAPGQSVTVTLDPNETQLDVAPVLGAGFDVWAGRRVRLRLLAIDQPRHQRPQPALDRVWRHDLSAHADVLVRL